MDGDNRGTETETKRIGAWSRNEMTGEWLGGCQRALKHRASWCQKDLTLQNNPKQIRNWLIQTFKANKLSELYKL